MPDRITIMQVIAETGRSDCGRSNATHTSMTAESVRFVRRLRLQVSPGNARLACPLVTFAVGTRNYCNTLRAAVAAGCKRRIRTTVRQSCCENYSRLRRSNVPQPNSETVPGDLPGASHFSTSPYLKARG